MVSLVKEVGKLVLEDAKADTKRVTKTARAIYF